MVLDVYIDAWYFKQTSDESDFAGIGSIHQRIPPPLNDVNNYEMQRIKG